jgi:uracil-DNA glycosylase
LDNALRLQYLHAMGIDVWLPNAHQIPPAIAHAVIPNRDVVATNPDGLQSPYAQLDWAALSQIPSSDSGCAIADNCKDFLPGQSPQQLHWLWLVETGEHEDAAQDAELLLIDLLSAIGLHRAKIFMTHILTAATPPAQENCRWFLLRQISLLQPKIILALGINAAKNLLSPTASLSELRGVAHPLANLGEDALTCSVVVTYAPADMLQSALDKRLAWQDLQLALTAFNH